MGLLVALLLLALPVAELVVIVQVAGSIGALNTLGLLLLVSIVGVSLARRAGLGALERLRRSQQEGTPPSRDLTDAALLLLAAFLLVLPGFISDVMGLALLLPPVRALVRNVVLQRLSKSRRVVLVGQTARTGGDEVWDVESWEEPPQPRPHGQIGDGQ
jgi:UPF0716 protein FxsA